MYKRCVEYIWIDGLGKLRSKTRVLPTSESSHKLSKIPIWNFDGSSTNQALGNDSEIILVPVFMCPDPFRKQNNVLVLCECLTKNSEPAKWNNRAWAKTIFDKVTKHQPWFGLEQEYVLYDNTTNRPLGWTYTNGPVCGQGKYYCGVGTVFGRNIADEHLKKCLGLKISGINAEVMPGQWEFQIGPCVGIDAGDQLWIARYILERICEKYNVTVNYDPKPVKGNWNGSGCHANYSTKEMRSDDGIEVILDAINKLSKKHKEHIEVYGTNDYRLTGKHETSSMDTFTYGVADRGASIRIPLQVSRDGKGYFEDRRPASDCDPYLVTAKIAETTLLFNDDIVLV